MFDAVLGLPVHVLVIHAVVVLGPLAALTGLAYALQPRWRRALRWPLLVAAAVVAATATVATRSGQALEARVIAQGRAGAEELQQILEHSEAGGLAQWAALAFLGVSAVVTGWLSRPGATGGRAAAGAVLLVVAAGWLAVQVVLAGHSGSTAVWSQIGG